MVTIAKDGSLPRTPTRRSFVAASAGFADGSDSPVAFLDRCLDAGGLWDPHIYALVNVNLDGARAAAEASTQRWRAGRTLSPIDGMPVGIKDIIETADMPTEYGCALFAGNRTERDAASVHALREAGAVIVAKTATTEFAANEPCQTRNPWDRSRTPGGSSSGSAAAVGAGILPAALGTQVIGSIIRPSSYCGTYGFKPSFGAINRGGSHDAFSQSAHGVIAATLAECWSVAHAISQRIGGDPGYAGLDGPVSIAPRKVARLAFLETSAWSTVSDGARAACARAFGLLRANGIEVISRWESDSVVAVEHAIADALPTTRDLLTWEGRWPFNTYRDRNPSKLAPSTLERLACAESMTIDDYRRLLQHRAKARAVYEGLASGVDACIGLSAASAAPVGLQTTGSPEMMAVSSYLGVPAITLPVLTDGGLPLGLQIIGFGTADADAMAIGYGLDRIFAQPQ